MKNVIIVCEDTYGLDVYLMIRDINERTPATSVAPYQPLGFISDTPNPFGKVKPPYPVLGTVEDWVVEEGVYFVMAIRDPLRKEKAVLCLKSKGARFVTIIDPWVPLPPDCKVGEGCIIACYVCKDGSRFGDFVTLDTVMCEAVEIGDYSTLCPFANITNAPIGKRVFVGSHAAVMAHKKVGDDARILPGSIVVSNVRSGTSVAGVPAKRL